MTHVARIELTNWFRFRRASIALGPRAYAVEAEQDGDPARSNWIGKTALAEAIPFALFGWHRFQEGERAPGFEDAWITEGEDSGGVVLELSDGARIERTRARVQSTQLRLIRKGMACDDPSFNAFAQERIEALVGLSADDYFSTAHVRQKACAALVNAKPAARMEMVAAWLDFAKLDEAGRLVAQKVTARGGERDRLAAKLAEVKVKLRDLGDEDHFGRRLRDVEDAGAFEAEARERVEEAERRSRDLLAAHAEWSRWQGGQAARERAEVAARQLVEEERRLAAMPLPGAGPDVAALDGLQRAAIEKAKSALAVARGEFDGRCPARPGFDCPARAEINAGCEETKAALDAAVIERNAATDAVTRARDEASKIRQAERERERQAERVAVLRSQAGGGSEIDLRSPPREVTAADVQLAQAGVRTGTAQLTALTRALADLNRLRTEVEKLAPDLADVDRKLVAARAARLVLGRGGAQRRIAESACEAIARGANLRLAVRGIDLRISLSWRREGAEPAPSCDACGTAFPRSRTARVCERCGASRGRAVQDRLDVSLSDRSGAAEDLAGLALQRSACAFLRRRRGSGWSTLVLDEPFGALDERHREAVARSLAAVREEDGVEQLLVVAHQPGVLETLPGRILIRARGGENEVEVIE